MTPLEAAAECVRKTIHERAENITSLSEETRQAYARHDATLVVSAFLTRLLTETENMRALLEASLDDCPTMMDYPRKLIFGLLLTLGDSGRWPRPTIESVGGEPLEGSGFEEEDADPSD